MSSLVPRTGQAAAAKSKRDHEDSASVILLAALTRGSTLDIGCLVCNNDEGLGARLRTGGHP